MQEPDRNAFNLMFVNDGEGIDDRLLVERDQHIAVAVHSLGNRQSQVTRDQRSGSINIDVVLFEAVFMGHLESVPVPCCCQQRGARAAALDQRIGSQRRAVNYERYITGFRARTPHDIFNSGQHGLARMVMGRQ